MKTKEAQNKIESFRRNKFTKNTPSAYSRSLTATWWGIRIRSFLYRRMQEGTQFKVNLIKNTLEFQILVPNSVQV